MEGIIHYELLERNLTVTAERYYQQLAVWRKQSSKNALADSMERFFSMQRPTAHCKHDENGHSGIRLGDSSTSALLSGPYPSHYHLFRVLSNNLR
jgi:hypothetical protein